MKCYKAFDKDFKCRNFQYEVGGTYSLPEGEKAKPCSNGFHACEYPFDVFNFYPMEGSRFAMVELSGEVVPEGDKVAASAIAIGNELTLDELIQHQVQRVLDNTPSKLHSASSGSNSHSASSGYYSTSASSGYGSTSASIGNSSHSASSGYGSTSASSGDSSHSASSGDCSRSASSGDSSHSASSGEYSHSASSGDGSTSASSGYGSTSASSGDYSASSAAGDKASAAVVGIGGKAKCGPGGAIALLYEDDSGQRKFAVGFAGEGGIKPDTMYQVRGGELVECA